ncbi:MAG: synthase [Bacteroidota bacterium]|jgi:NAD+ synthase
MQSQKIIDHIVEWLRAYSSSSHTKGFVVGVSGGIDSALTSYLCALTGQPTLLLEMPIHQAASQVTRAQDHMRYLCEKFPHVRQARVELTASFEAFKAAVDTTAPQATVDMALANTRARLRMTALYYHAGLHGYVVAGTGNKVEDFGIGFYTKYGDGGVDVSPIADLMKTEVYALAKHLGIIESILTAAPTDGLFGDSRTDEDQIGASYPELEWAMRWLVNTGLTARDWANYAEKSQLNSRQIEVMDIYVRRHLANQHKMIPIPVCEIPEGFLVGG